MTTIPSFTGELVEIMYAEGSRVIEAQVRHPKHGGKITAKTKRQLRNFWDTLIRLSCKTPCSFYAPKYARRLVYEPGQIRHAYQHIAAEAGISESMAIKHTRELEHLGLVIRLKERHNLGAKGLASPETLKRQLANFDLKVLMLNFDLLDSWYERNVNIDPEIERINQAPEYQPYTPTELEQLLTDSLEPVIESDIETFDDAVLTAPKELQFEKEAENFGNQETLVSTHVRDIEIRPDSEDSCSATAYQNPSSVSEEKATPLITPPLDDEWKVLVCDGGVKRQRETKPLSALPEKPKGEYYATWIAERAGLFWSPWIVWDLDNKESLETARDWTRKLVKRLLDMGCPESALRIVFSTRKGFHVYLDSRTVGLKPSKNLHMQLRDFCIRLSPECDRSLYGSNRVIGLPNSKHRETGWYYALVPVRDLSDHIAQIKMLTVKQHDLPARGDVELVPRLVEEWERTIFQATPQTGKFPSFSKLQQIAHDPLPEFNGVGEGNRDAALFRMANYYQRLGLTEPETLDLCLAINRRNKPPLTEKEVSDKVQRAFHAIERRTL